MGDYLYLICGFDRVEEVHEVRVEPSGGEAETSSQVEELNCRMTRWRQVGHSVRPGGGGTCVTVSSRTWTKRRGREREKSLTSRGRRTSLPLTFSPAASMTSTCWNKTAGLRKRRGSGK
eukprot:755833-Hanusia_phi.AAC.2